MKKFPSKRDLWFVLVMWCAVGAMLYGVAAAPAIHGIGEIAARSVLGVPSAALALWVLYGTSYSLTETNLIVRAGPFRYRIPLATIRSVERTRSLASAPACSLDRLRIAHAAGSIVISPRDRQDFVQELSLRAPLLQSS